MRVALVTTVDPEVLTDDLDRPFLVAAFDRHGVEAVWCAWEDADVDWYGFDLVVVRSPWNYVEHEAAFRAFLERFRDSPRFLNPAGLIEWNLDKRHLRELEDRGVPTVPTVFVDSSDTLSDALASVSAPEIVIKPTVSAGSRLTGRFVAGSAAAFDLGMTILREGRSVMVQPYLPDVDAEGEYAVVVIDGRIVHRARKAQILDVGGTFVGGAYREVITPEVAVPDLEAVAALAAAECRALARDREWLAPDAELLYARYDIARTPDGGAVLLEAELFEPALFLPARPAAADALAAAIERRVRRAT